MNNNNINSSNVLISKVSVDTGLSTAWLLATLGSKTTYRRLVRKDILSISIPQTCDIIGNPQSAIPLRLSSNLLYGVSLMYKQKIDYFLSDVSLIKTKLQKEIFLNTLTNKQNFTVININHLQYDNFKARDQNQIFLKEDPFFDVSRDLFNPFTLSEEQDERRQRIQQLDQQLYHDMNLSLFTSVGQITVVPDVHTKTIENFMDQELHTLDELSESLKSDAALDFEFGDDGKIVNINLGSKEHENEDLSIIDFDQVIERSEDSLDSITEGAYEKTITNDKTFHMSHDTHTNQTTILDTNKSIKRKRNYRKIIIDESMKISSSELKNFRDSYDNIMNIHNKRIKIANFAKQRISSVNELLYEENNEEPFATKYTCKCIFGPEITDDIKLNSRTPVRFNSKQLSEDLEFGRNIEPRINDEEMDKFNFEIEQDINLEFNDLQDIFDLSFPEINNSELRSRSRSKSGSKRSGSKSTRSSSVPNDQEFLEESLDYTPGAPHLLTQRIGSQTKITATLVKFLNFLQSRSILLGEHVKADCKLSRNYFQYINKETSNSNEIVYSKIKFSNLIPLVKSKLRNGTEIPVNRNLAANSFSSILELATRNYIMLEVENNRNLQTGDEIEILIEI
ncbi:uncharacterized protein AC631_01974 [Debaryomyces fabryi]|uniref:Rad21/Rec8-like protein N-terminal domain-containing protein n=1 Tax=Debaryomyces fabryi TaxID=58627 RepID=A0A0V1Q142_9ASCO|nr:uncharacterized protein AC631_01974 [Debaryomyces fabryi]KSA02238.1 hypothetical protein AC631_01974 [Debaryomyces fabryi]CUM46926.1 unnamed protein product [Debaryomyces fabryi]